MRYPNLQGKRSIGLVRCSTIGQADTSIGDQMVVLAAFAAEHEMTCVDTIQLEGVSGSIPGNRTDIADLIARKQSKDDFEILLVQDTTRLTRSGAGHGAMIEYELSDVGVEIVFVADNLPDGEYAEMFKPILYEMGKQHAKSISYNVARGLMSALQHGYVSYCRTAPFGVDKMYIGADGEPHHIIRDLRDGTELMLNPVSREIVQRFGRFQQGTLDIPRHYVKQPDERVVLIPGDEEKVAFVQRLFRRYYFEGWGLRRITIEANQSDISSPRGGTWCTTTISNILKNTVYTGYGISNRSSRALYNELSPEQPKRVTPDKRTRNGKRKTLPRRLRPRKEWFIQQLPELASFLEPEICELARKRHEQLLTAKSAGGIASARKDKHLDSPYVLTNILTSKQGNHPMTGRYLGTGKWRKRYYGVRRDDSYPTGDRVLSKKVPAEPIEEAVLGMLRTVLLAAPDLPAIIQKSVDCCRRIIRRDQTDLPELLKKRAKLKAKMEFAWDQFDESALDTLKDRIAKLQSEIIQLDDQIHRAQPQSPASSVASDHIVERALHHLRTLGQSLDSTPVSVVRQILASVVERLSIDLETREVELALRLPSWAVEHPDAMCLSSSPPKKTATEAHDECGVPLVTMRFLWDAREWQYLGIDLAA